LETNEPLEIAQLAAEAALSRRARNVKILDLREVASFADYFVICSGTSDRHLDGITDIVLEKLKEHNFAPWHKEGEKQHSDWVLLDYVDVVIHIFLKEAREFYNLERLWVEAKLVELPEDIELEEEYQEEFEDFDELEDFDEDLFTWYEDE